MVEHTTKARRGRAGLLAAAAAALGFLVWSQAAPRLWLDVVQCGSGERLLSVPVEHGEVFSIWFFHSYDRSFFEEHYRVRDDGGFLLSRMTFKSALNGQGFEAGTYRPLPDGSAELSGIDRKIEEIVFRLGSPDLANHTLILPGRRLRLLDYAEAGALLCIRLARQPPGPVAGGMRDPGSGADDPQTAHRQEQP